MASTSDRHVDDLNSHLRRGFSICRSVYEPLPLMGDLPALAKTVDGKLVITNERKSPNGEPVIERAACFGKPKDATGKPGTVAVLKK